MFEHSSTDPFLYVATIVIQEMSYAVPVFLAVLLVCSLPAMAVGGAGAGASPHGPTAGADDETLAGVAIDHAIENRSIERLFLQGPVTDGYTQAHTDLGTSLASGGDGLRDDYAFHRIESQTSGESMAAYRERIEMALEQEIARADGFEAREQALLGEHTDEELVDVQLVSELVRFDNGVRSQKELFDRFDELENDVPGLDLQMENRDRLMDWHMSPGRNYASLVGQGFGDGDGSTVAVQTRSDGLVFETLDSGIYYREAVRHDNRDPTGSSDIGSVPDVVEFVNTQYPFAFEHSETNPTPDYFTAPDVGLFYVTFDHDHGATSVAIDSGAGDVFREYHTLRLDDLPTQPVGDPVENDTLRLALNETPDAGPMDVSVTDSGTDLPVDAAVYVDDVRVGTTGTDGSRWILPAADEFELTIRTDDRELTATVDPGTTSPTFTT